ncbi:MAG TPA: hypothetical protein VFW66_09745 [Gemmatimonadales bacterium]|nr:hypothetical protein [Gemmatimonadales bacterium]
MTIPRGHAMRKSQLKDERGIALVIAIVALVVIGAIVAGTFFVSTLEQRTSYNALASSQASEAAEAGLQDATANWNTAWNSLTAPSTSGVIAGPALASGAVDSYTVAPTTSVNPSLFVVTSWGTSNGTKQTLASVLRLLKANVVVNAAVTAGGNVQVGGNAAIQGANTNPSGWSGCATAPDQAGIRSSGTINTNGNPSIAGTPQTVPNDASVNSATFQTPFQQLKQVATLNFTGGSGSGNYVTFTNIAPVSTGSPATCDRSNMSNWGEPLRTGTYVSACTNYAPVVYINGNAKFNSQGRGQGILLVEGDLSIAGGFQWVGLVIATGQVKTGNGTSNVTGSILAENADIGDQTSFSGTPVVSYSQCALAYVLQQSAVARPLAGRSWTPVF